MTLTVGMALELHWKARTMPTLPVSKTAALEAWIRHFCDMDEVFPEGYPADMNRTLFQRCETLAVRRRKKRLSTEEEHSPLVIRSGQRAPSGTCEEAHHTPLNSRRRYGGVIEGQQRELEQLKSTVQNVVRRLEMQSGEMAELRDDNAHLTTLYRRSVRELKRTIQELEIELEELRASGGGVNGRDERKRDRDIAVMEDRIEKLEEELAKTSSSLQDAESMAIQAQQDGVTGNAVSVNKLGIVVVVNLWLTLPGSTRVADAKTG